MPLAVLNPSQMAAAVAAPSPVSGLMKSAGQREMRKSFSLGQGLNSTGGTTETLHREVGSTLCLTGKFYSLIIVLYMDISAEWQLRNATFFSQALSRSKESL